jgi:imidazolonepropionase-like amidohydrolase
VLPGIIDAHTHPAGSAQNLDKGSLGGNMILPTEFVGSVGQREEFSVQEQEE